MRSSHPRRSFVGKLARVVFEDSTQVVADHFCKGQLVDVVVHAMTLRFLCALFALLTVDLPAETTLALSPK